MDSRSQSQDLTELLIRSIRGWINLHIKLLLHNVGQRTAPLVDKCHQKIFRSKISVSLVSACLESISLRLSLTMSFFPQIQVKILNESDKSQVSIGPKSCDRHTAWEILGCSNVHVQSSGVNRNQAPSFYSSATIVRPKWKIKSNTPIFWLKERHGWKKWRASGVYLAWVRRNISFHRGSLLLSHVRQRTTSSTFSPELGLLFWRRNLGFHSKFASGNGSLTIFTWFSIASSRLGWNVS